MIALLDTSVIVAGIIQSHREHERSRRWLGRGRTEGAQVWCSQHALAETFSILARAPWPVKISAIEAQTVVNANIREDRIVRLGPEDYRECMDWCTRVQAGAGAIYDLLHLQAAKLCGATQIVTLNQREFVQLWEGDPAMIIEP